MWKFGLEQKMSASEMCLRKPILFQCLAKRAQSTYMYTLIQYKLQFKDDMGISSAERWSIKQ